MVGVVQRPHLRVLGDRDRSALAALCDRDPTSNVFVAERILSGVPLGRGGQMWGWFEDGHLVSACWSGANLVVAEATPAAVDAFAGRAEHEGRRCSSIFGPAEPTLALWQRLSGQWGRAREIRPSQPLMRMDAASPLPGDPLVRRAELDDLGVLIPACVAMFIEEVGYSPVDSDGGWSYRARIEHLVRTGRSFLRRHNDTVVFKAEVGAVSRTVAQIQGVYVHPYYRGTGLAAPGMASVVNQTLQVVPTVSLYVNDYNTRAIAAYERVGFRRVGEFATVLF